MMRPITLAAFMLLAAPAEAHCFSVWHYPWAQRCGVAVTHVTHVTPPPKTNDIPIPELTPIAGGEPDEATRARLLLRAALAGEVTEEAHR